MSSAGGIGGGGGNVYIPAGGGNTAPAGNVEGGANVEGQGPAAQPIPTGDGVGFTGGADTSGVGSTVGGPVIQGNDSAAGNFPAVDGMGTADFDSAKALADAFATKAEAAKQEAASLKLQLTANAAATQALIANKAALQKELDGMPAPDDRSDAQNARFDQITQQLMPAVDRMLEQKAGERQTLLDHCDALGAEIDQARAVLQSQLNSLKNREEQATKNKEAAAENKKSEDKPFNKLSPAQADALAAQLGTTLSILDQVKQATESAEAIGEGTNSLSANMKGGA